MRPNPVRRRVLAGELSLGTFVFEFNSTGIGRLAAEAGAEFAIYDMEHTGWTLETIRQLVATTRPTEMSPIVRIPATEYHFIARVLDVGAEGIMAPMVESGEQAARLVASAKYPPVGRRGAAFGIAHDNYTSGSIVEKMESANRETLLIAQIETVGGLDHLEAIASTPGIDVLWIGQFDLSNSLGIPGQFEHPRFVEAVSAVLDACRRHHKVPGFLATDVPSGRQLIAQGFKMLAYGGDLWLYQAALRDGLAGLRATAPSSPSA